jgi:hypothetical protein
MSAVGTLGAVRGPQNRSRRSKSADSHSARHNPKSNVPVDARVTPSICIQVAWGMQLQFTAQEPECNVPCTLTRLGSPPCSSTRAAISAMRACCSDMRSSGRQRSRPRTTPRMTVAARLVPPPVGMTKLSSSNGLPVHRDGSGGNARPTGRPAAASAALKNGLSVDIIVYNWQHTRSSHWHDGTCLQVVMNSSTPRTTSFDDVHFTNAACPRVPGPLRGGGCRRTHTSHALTCASRRRGTYDTRHGRSVGEHAHLY